jgi:hypothetical protein
MPGLLRKLALVKLNRRDCLTAACSGRGGTELVWCSLVQAPLCNTLAPAAEAGAVRRMKDRVFFQRQSTSR